MRVIWREEKSKREAGQEKGGQEKGEQEGGWARGRVRQRERGRYKERVSRSVPEEFIQDMKHCQITIVIF